MNEKGRFPFFIFYLPRGLPRTILGHLLSLIIQKRSGGRLIKLAKSVASVFPSVFWFCSYRLNREPQQTPIPIHQGLEELSKGVGSLFNSWSLILISRVLTRNA
jgi:hypothetical protein